LIGDDHGDIVAAACQGSSEEGLLHRLASDTVLPIFRREHWQIVKADQADLHLTSSQARARWHR
jgi:hypothetical protein